MAFTARVNANRCIGEHGDTNQNHKSTQQRRKQWRRFYPCRREYGTDTSRCEITAQSRWRWQGRRSKMRIPLRNGLKSTSCEQFLHSHLVPRARVSSAVVTHLLRHLLKIQNGSRNNTQAKHRSGNRHPTAHSDRSGSQSQVVGVQNGGCANQRSKGG